MMFTIVFNNGEYRDTNATTMEEAVLYMNNLLSEEEIKELEAEVVEA